MPNVAFHEKMDVVDYIPVSRHTLGSVSVRLGDVKMA